ncbi:hypothetical protein ACFPTY_19905 [Halomonas beimenensis]|uniref:hypothetical protein n=1 Tax=Halomonas beimenensis TaxID=475662 RepID=UPI003619CFBB
MNNQKAVIKVGTDEFFVTDIDFDDENSTITGSDSTSTSVELTPFFSASPGCNAADWRRRHDYPARAPLGQRGERSGKGVTIGERDVTCRLRPARFARPTAWFAPRVARSW